MKRRRCSQLSLHPLSLFFVSFSIHSHCYPHSCILYNAYMHTWSHEFMREWLKSQCNSYNGLMFSFLYLFCVEKPSTALWTRALLLRQACQRTTTQCWAHMTRKTTSLSAKQVQSCTIIDYTEILVLLDVHVSMYMYLLQPTTHRLKQLKWLIAY